MFIPDPGSWFLPFPDPITATKERGEKKFGIILFFAVTNFKKFNIVLFLKCRKKIWANFQRIIEVFTQNIFTMLSNIWVWDPRSKIRDRGSGKNLFWIPDPGSRGQKGTGSWIPDPGSGSATLNVQRHHVQKLTIRHLIANCAVRPILLWLCLYIVQDCICVMKNSESIANCGVNVFFFLNVIFLFSLVKATMNASCLCKLSKDCLIALGYETTEH
jgi:hypothetical protein